MLNRAPTQPRHSVCTVETATPQMDPDELMEKEAKGWRRIRTVERPTKTGNKKYVHEFERYDRPMARAVENRIVAPVENRGTNA